MIFCHFSKRSTPRVSLAKKFSREVENLALLTSHRCRARALTTGLHAYSHPLHTGLIRSHNPQSQTIQHVILLSPSVFTYSSFRHQLHVATVARPRHNINAITVAVRCHCCSRRHGHNQGRVKAAARTNTMTVRT